MAVLLFQKEKLFDTAVYIGTLVIPGVIRVMLGALQNRYENLQKRAPTLSVSDHESVR